MTALTVADIKRRVKRRFGDESAVQLTDTDILDAINDAQRTIVGRNPDLLLVTALASTVASQQEYSLPVDIYKFKYMSYRAVGEVSYRPLRGLNENEFNLYIDDWDSNTEALAVPQVYFLRGSTFIVYPIPQDSLSNAFKIHYNRRPTDRTADADVIDLPELYHKTVVDLVLQDAYEMDEDWEAAGAKSSQTNIDLDRLRSSEEWTQRDTYSTITVLPEDM